RGFERAGDRLFGRARRKLEKPERRRRVRRLPRRGKGTRGLSGPRLPPSPRASVTSEDLSILLLTLRVAALAMLLVVPVGIAAAYLMARRTGPGRTVAETLFTLPLVL